MREEKHDWKKKTIRCRYLVTAVSFSNIDRGTTKVSAYIVDKSTLVGKTATDTATFCFVEF